MVVDVPLSATYFVVAHFHMVMGVCADPGGVRGIYHWYPKVTGRMLNDTLGQVPFLGHVPRDLCDLLPDALSRPPGYAAALLRLWRALPSFRPRPQTLNAFITVAALIVGAAQLVFLFNLIWSLFNGKPAGGNPWRATTLEWQTPETPPGHGNWGKELPVVYRWAYDYSVPGAAQGFRAAKRTAGRTSWRR